MPKTCPGANKEKTQAATEVALVELGDAELENVVAGLSGKEGGALLVGLALAPGINLGIVAFALTTGIGFILADTWYNGFGGRGGSLPR